MEERRGFDKGISFPPKPVEVGEEYEVDIEEISRKGDGIARIEGLVTFVPNTKQGEHVKIKITNIGRTFAEAEVVEEAESVEEEPEEEVIEEEPEEEIVEEEPEEEVIEEDQ
ncbi:MAG: TRAM domain-containing protein [Thermoproteota archaeon]